MSTTALVRRWLTQGEVASLLGYSPRTVRRLVEAGIFPPPVRITGPLAHPRWSAVVVEGWLAGHEPRGNA